MYNTKSLVFSAEFFACTAPYIINLSVSGNTKLYQYQYTVDKINQNDKALHSLYNQDKYFSTSHEKKRFVDSMERNKSLFTKVHISGHLQSKIHYFKDLSNF